MMRHTRAAALVGAVAALPAAAVAQGAASRADSAGPRGGTWAAEVALGDYTSGRLLRFMSPGAAWLVGVDFALTRERERESGAPAGSTDTQTRTRVAARAGLRWYRDAGRALRPLTGLGLTGTVLDFSPGVRSWDAGVYGELGAAYFFSRHVSLGAAGELTAGYGEDRRDAGAVQVRATRWTVGSTLVRVLAAVYF